MGSRPVRRTIVVSALVAAAALGTTSGIGLHRAFPGTRDVPSASPTPAASSAQPPAPSPSSSSPTASTPAATRTPQPTPKPTPNPTVTPEPGPPFTERALLLEDEFVEYGWVSAQLVQRYDQLPTPPITPCTTIGHGPGFVQAYAAIYASARTNAAEVAVRFDSVGHAKDAFVGMRTDVQSCATSPTIETRRVEIGRKTVPPDASSVSELIWWRTRDLDGGPGRGVLGIARADDRVLVVSLESRVSDPVDTTEVDDLLIQATRRLV